MRTGHGWQCDGGHCAYMLAEETTCLLLPEELSYVDGALVACGFGTAWECLTRMAVSGKDRMLVGAAGSRAGRTAPEQRGL